MLPGLTPRWADRISRDDQDKTIHTGEPQDYPYYEETKAARKVDQTAKQEAELQATRLQAELAELRRRIEG